MIATRQHLLVNVEGRDDLGEGHVLGDGSGYSDLVDAEVGVGSDDRPGREVNSLPHEVSSDAPLLALEARLDGFERLAALLHGPGQAGHVVVDQRCHVELQHLYVFGQDVRRCARLLVPHQLVVCFQDIG